MFQAQAMCILLTRREINFAFAWRRHVWYALSILHSLEHSVRIREYDECYGDVEWIGKLYTTRWSANARWTLNCWRRNVKFSGTKATISLTTSSYLQIRTINLCVSGALHTLTQTICATRMSEGKVLPLFGSDQTMAVTVLVWLLWCYHQKWLYMQSGNCTAVHRGWEREREPSSVHANTQIPLLMLMLRIQSTGKVKLCQR